MPRWEDGSEERLKKAAMELFEEQGFENTSVVQIAERARVTTRTFFRYFSDKREVLFAESDTLREALIEKVLQAPDVDEPLHVVLGVLSNFDWERLGSRKLQRQRQAMIAENPELLERDLMKNHSIALGFIEALRQRGVDEDRARLAALAGIELFITAYTRWLEAGSKTELSTMSERAISLLASLLTPIAKASPSRSKITSGQHPRQTRRPPAKA